MHANLKPVLWRLSQTTKKRFLITNWGRYLSISAMTDGTPVPSYYDQTKTALGFAMGNLQEEDGIQTWKWTHEEVDGYADETGLTRVTVDDLRAFGRRRRYGSGGSTRHHERQPIRAQSASDGTWTTGIAASGHSTPSNTGLWLSL